VGWRACRPRRLPGQAIRELDELAVLVEESQRARCADVDAHPLGRPVRLPSVGVFVTSVSASVAASGAVLSQRSESSITSIKSKPLRRCGRV
jgi:hypothetical protein